MLTLVDEVALFFRLSEHSPRKPTNTLICI